MKIRQYYHRGLSLPAPGDVREITDRRTGMVCKLGRVTRINSHDRMAEIEIIKLDRNGKEVRK